MIVTDPLAKPTAIWDRSSKTAKAETYGTVSATVKIVNVVASRGWPNWELSPRIIDRDRRQTSRGTSFLLGCIERPNL